MPRDAAVFAQAQVPIPTLQGVQQPPGRLVAVDRRPGLDGQRGGRFAQFRRKIFEAGVDVKADAEHEGGPGRERAPFHEDSRHLPVPNRDVVRPANSGMNRQAVLERLGDGNGGHDREQVALLDLKFRPEHHRQEQAGARRAVPGPSHSAPAGRLLLGHDRRSLGRAPEGHLPGDVIGRGTGFQAMDLKVHFL